MDQNDGDSKIQQNERSIIIRINRAKDTLDDARLLFLNQRYNSAINRLYYACFYMMNALLLSQKNEAQTHQEVKIQLIRSFIKTGKLSVELGNHYISLYDYCQEADYSDFIDFDKETTEILMIKTEEFIKELNNHLITQKNNNIC